jgi:MSHA biogenesis protein MshO
MSRQRGFTLVELIVVMVVTGVLVGGISVFFLPSVNNYLAVGRRAGLTDMMDGATRAMSRDIRAAVPNSIRIATSQCFELVPTSAGGRYRTAPDTAWDATAAAADRSLPLDTTTSSSGFDVTSPLNPLPAAGDLVVIDNQNGEDVYTGANTQAIAAVDAPPSTGGNPPLGLHRITLTAAKQFPVGYEGGRFVVVPAAQQAVFYVCANANKVNGTGTGTLYRFSGYGLNAAAPSSCPIPNASTPMLATKVESCEFIYNPNAGAAQDAGYMQMKLKLTDKDESVQILFGTHADNVP